MVDIRCAIREDRIEEAVRRRLADDGIRILLPQDLIIKLIINEHALGLCDRAERRDDVAENLIGEISFELIHFIFARRIVLAIRKQYRIGRIGVDLLRHGTEEGKRDILLLQFGLEQICKPRLGAVLAVCMIAERQLGALLAEVDIEHFFHRIIEDLALRCRNARSIADIDAADIALAIDKRSQHTVHCKIFRFRIKMIPDLIEFLTVHWIVSCSLYSADKQKAAAGRTGGRCHYCAI